MDEQKAFDVFCARRWPNGRPTCPKCSCKRFYFLNRGQRFKCADCYHQYTATSGTIWARRKMTYSQLVFLLDAFEGNRSSILQIAKTVGIQYKCVWLLHKKWLLSKGGA